MPLQVARLRDSDLAAEVDPEACWYAVLLWAASWHQVPAASLPDNEAVLMRLVGLGRDQRTWRKHRDGALRGFVPCSDGRMYHPVVAEQAMAAWKSKIEQRYRTECARVKKSNQRNGTDLPSPEFVSFLSQFFPASVPFLSLGTAEVVLRDIASKGKGQGERQGQGQGDHDLDADASGGDDEEIEVDDGDSLKPEHFVEAWNELADRITRPKIRALTPERRQALRARINGHTIEDFQEVLGNIERSPFLRGDRNWPGVTFDWITKKGNFQKILEGNYGQ